jgi:dolichol-phosphate mannosyltransferase
MTSVIERLSPQPEVIARVAPLELSVVIPTYNERANVSLILGALEKTLSSTNWEAIFVDDHSPDRTADEVRSIAVSNPRVRLIERIGRRGLSSACIEGMMASAAPFLAVIDADMQHDESVLPQMLRLLQSGSLDVVVASRRIDGGSMGDFAKARVRLSDLGSRVSRLVCHCDVTDPMSGFFVVDSMFFRAAVPRLTGTGFKILLDILASSPTLPRVAEVPYRFRNRLVGESKLDVNVELEYLFLVVDKLLGEYVPTRFALFVCVGSLGLLIHLSILGLFHLMTPAAFSLGQVAATFAAMTFNFFLNNLVTFRDRRLKGIALIRGMLIFYAACTLGVLINLSFSHRLLVAGLPWYLAGLSGLAISAVWNYGVNTVVTWRRARSLFSLSSQMTEPHRRNTHE